MKKSVLVSAATAIAAMALTVSATPATAAPWPAGGTFEIPGTMAGGAAWDIDQYGISAGYNIPDTFPGLFYPLENYAYSGNVYCGAIGGSDSTVTNESNGDITVDCQPVQDTFVTGLTGTLHIRFYAEDPSGYLARVWVELENTTGATIDLSADPLAVYYYYNYNSWDNGDPWMTNAGGGDDGLDGSVWGAGGDIENHQIATSSSWADVSQSCRIKTLPHAMYYPADANIIAPGATVNLVSFINMVFPATDDAAGNTGAFNTALNNAQTEMAAGLTGRMAAGLPEGLVATGWEKNDACVTPALANTGIDSSTSVALALGVSALAAAGLALTVVSRRRRHQ